MQNLDHLFSQLPEALHVHDAEGRIIFWNIAAENLYGYTSDEALGRQSDELLKVQSVPKPSSNVFHENPDRWLGEIQAETSAGKSIRIRRRLMRVQEARPRETRTRETADVTGTVVFDAEVNQTSKHEQADRRRQRLESLGSLASGIAHDLNNLLTPILMSCKMLQRKNPNVDSDALLETIGSGARRGAELIAQLLTFARGGEGTHTMISAESFVPETVAILKRAIQDDIKVELDLAKSLPSIWGDETELSQVIMNLAINARDAMPDGGNLSVRVSPRTLTAETSFSATILPAGDYLAIELADTGVGIPPEIRDQIFDPFFTTKCRGQGTGLGLSTTIGIVKSHGGAIGIDSTIDQGTTVTVMLPVAANPRSTKSPIARSP